MGSNRALGSGDAVPHAMAGRHGVSAGRRSYAAHRGGWPGQGNSRRGSSIVRGRNLIILATGIVVVIAAVVLTINLTGRSGANGQRTASSKPGAAHAGGTHPNPQPLPPGAVSPTIGLRPG